MANVHYIQTNHILASPLLDRQIRFYGLARSTTHLLGTGHRPTRPFFFFSGNKKCRIWEVCIVDIKISMQLINDFWKSSGWYLQSFREPFKQENIVLLVKFS